MTAATSDPRTVLPWRRDGNSLATGAYATAGLILPSRRARPPTQPPASGTAPRDLSAGPVPVTRPPASEEELYWFRWIHGHQVSFLVWQFLATALDRLARRHPTSGRRTAAQARSLVRCYSAMLLYCSSCPQSVYHDYIRPRMVRQHPAFSGTWAQDYQPVAKFLRGRDQLGGGGEVRALLSERDLNLEAHQAVAAKLVPNGRSLLREARAEQSAIRPPSAMAMLLFDDFFLTQRRETTCSHLLEQLIERLRTCHAELAVNGACPSAKSLEELPTEFRTRPILRLVEELGDVVDATAWAAADLLERASHGLAVAEGPALGGFR